MPAPPQIPHDDRLVAALDLLGRMGAKNVSVRWHDEEQPTAWVVVGEWAKGHDAGGGMTPAQAAIRLADQVMVACAHCGRAAGVAEDWQEEQPGAAVVCWYVYDPETKRFRRSCEGETKGRAFGMDPKTGAVVGRNDPCPCGSGKKWKRCHGA